MEIWESGIASKCFDLPKLSAAWFKKKKKTKQGLILGSRLPWSPDCPWTQVDHVTQATLELAEASQVLGLQERAWIWICFEWRFVEGIFFFLLVKKKKGGGC